MRLSKLQKYILLQCYYCKGKKMKREGLVGFYKKSKRAVKKELRAKIITKSIERLINKELMVGYGVRTPYKWFIKEIKLTKKGIKQAKQLLGEQQILPFKHHKSIKTIN